MSKVTIKQASIIVGKGLRTIYDDIAKGRVTSKKNEQGVKEIDLAELHRAYGVFIVDPKEARKPPQSKNRKPPQTTAKGSVSDSDSDLARAITLLMERQEASEKLIEKQTKVIEGLTDTVQALTHRLEHQPSDVRKPELVQEQPPMTTKKSSGAKVTSIADLAAKYLEK